MIRLLLQPEEKRVANDRKMLDRLMALGEDRLEQFLQELVNNPAVVNAFNNAVKRAGDAKTRAEDTFKQVLNAAQIPQTDVLAELNERIALLENKIADLTPRLQAFVERALATKPTDPPNT